ncbi:MULTISPECIES: isocitrate lyase/phosphoenolpyruvate mutase family protein [unclassified Streptomyces]|uniref:isocitrate lyase/phosphoenolpyruvate mutase family protein n=1 Tax=unclassified Streptomyces TaxID=2593676 RepID=UPI00093DCD22|nr:isocitrate lyase/phosphoenolpyruvate mutase family protein [Streptomyces sp. CB01883]OKJ74417.1 phosphoenolpyruvate phosphomutase [Streptomyces sp. CB01883]
MLKRSYPSFRSLVERGELVRVAGAHDALGAVLAEQAGFDAVWSSSLEVSAARCLPDASVLTMTEYLEAASNMQKALGIPVIADCDTGYGNNLNVVHMVHEYEAAGITAVCMEDKLFPKLNSFASGDQTLLSSEAFCSKIRAAKNAQSTEDFYVVARTEALINGLSVDVALERSHAYCDAGADAVLIHSKSKTKDQVEEFLSRWDGRRPVVIVPTTYPDWHVDDIVKAGVSVVIYANQGLRATVSSLRETFESICRHGDSTHLEDRIAAVSEVFELQQLKEWQKLDV